MAFYFHEMDLYFLRGSLVECLVGLGARFVGFPGAGAPFGNALVIVVDGDFGNVVIHGVLMERCCL